MLVKRSFWCRVKQDFSGYIIRALQRPTVMIDGIEIFVDYKGWSKLLIKRVTTRRYEVEERLLIPLMVSPTDTVVELGGGIGLVGMLCARIVGAENVYVYEANAQIASTAKNNFSRNGYPIHIEHAAVVASDYQGKSVIFHVSKNFWSSSLLERENLGTDVKVTIPAVCIDDLIKKYQPSVLIIDIEGAEYDLLLNADLTGVQKICVEVHTRYIGTEKVSSLIKSLLNRDFILDISSSIE